MNVLARIFDTFHNGDDVIRVVAAADSHLIVGKDVCAALGISKYRDALAQLDDDERVSAAVDTPGGEQQMVLVNESGLYALMMISRSSKAKDFRKWVTKDVLPAIQRTGRYEIGQSHPSAPARAAEEISRRELALMVLEAEDRADAALALAAEKTQHLAVVAPKAEAWDVLASAEGDWAVADAAKVLSRDPNIKLGQQRLFNYLGEIGWLYRARGDRRWRVRQDQIETGRLSEIPSSHYHPRTGDLVLDPPQVRITTKGMQELHRRLGGHSQHAISA